MWYEFKQLLHHNDPFTWIVLIISLLAYIFIIERSIFLGVIYNINAKKFVSDLLKIVAAADYDRAISFCKKTSKVGIPKIMERAITSYVADPQSVKGKLEEESLDFIPNIETRLSVIYSLGYAGLTIGLAGAMTGIWTAFNQGGLVDGTLQQDIINSGVSRALNTSVFTIIMTTIILFFHTLLKAGAQKQVDATEVSVLKVINVLAPPTAVTYAMAAPAAIQTSPTDDVGSSGTTEDEPSDDVSEPVNNNAEDEAYDIKDEEEII